MSPAYGVNVYITELQIKVMRVRQQQGSLPAVGGKTNSASSKGCHPVRCDTAEWHAGDYSLSDQASTKDSTILRISEN